MKEGHFLVSFFFSMDGTEIAIKDQKTAKLSLKKEYGHMWQAWITGVLGIWLIIASFVFNGNVFNELVVGVTVAVMGFSAAVK